MTLRLSDIPGIGSPFDGSDSHSLPLLAQGAGVSPSDVLLVAPCASKRLGAGANALLVDLAEATSRAASVHGVPVALAATGITVTQHDLVTVPRRSVAWREAVLPVDPADPACMAVLAALEALAPEPDPEPEPGQSLPSAAALAFLEKAAKGIKGALDADGAAEALALWGWRTSTVVEPQLLSGEQLTGLLRGLGLLPPRARSYPPAPEFDGRRGESLECRFQAWHKHDLEGASTLARALEPFKSTQAVDELGALSLLNVRVDRAHDVATVVVGDAYLGVPCLRVDIGKTRMVAHPKISGRGTPESFITSPPERLWKYLYDNGLKARAKAALAEFGAGRVDAILRPKRASDGTEGTCAACFGGYKLRDNAGRKLMVLHGYKRPGIGFIEGRCVGTEYEPYELSCEGTKAALAMIPGWIEGARRAIKRLQARPEVIEKIQPRGPVLELRREAETARERGYYESELKHQIAQWKQTLEGLDRQREDYTRAIESWRLRPLP